MSIHNKRMATIRAHGLSDAVDGSNAFPGAMSILSNIVPSQDTKDNWVPRPASSLLTSFAGFASPGFVSGSLVVGDIEYGMIASALNAGKDQPFAFNLKTGLFLTVNGITAPNVPTSPATSGDWVPPILALIGTRVIVTHPGFPGGATKFGWFDISGFSDTTHTGNTHSSTLIDNLSANVLLAGWQPGMTIAGAGIPANTTIVSIASGGLSLTLSQAATATAAGVALTVAGGTTAAPLWGAGDTNLFNLPSTPVSVAQFNGRAYYACANGVVWSDSLAPCTRTNANQAVTFGNGLNVTALGALPLSSPITGGITQAIIAFQGVSALQQITGDQATTNLLVNQMDVATGTQAPLSICSTNFGLAFISPEGLRFITFSATVTDPVGDSGSGVTIPFLYAISPSRICAAANADVIRISVQNGAAQGTPNQEYWFDITRKVWSGPHTFPASLIQPWGNTFAMHPAGILAKTFQSDVQISATSSFTENGTALQWTHKTVLLPDNDMGCMNATVESTVAVALPSGYNLTVQAVDEQGNDLNTVSIVTTGTTSLWGTLVWGAGLWSGATNAFRQYRVPWTQPLVYKQASHVLSGASVAGVKIGDLRIEFQELGYLLGDPYVAAPFPTKPFVLDQSALDGSDVLG